MTRRAVNLFVLGMCATLCACAVSAQQLAPTVPAPTVPAPTAPAPAEPTGPAPHIKFDTAEANLGDVVHGQDAGATFTSHNTGDAPLHILSAKPG